MQQNRLRKCIYKTTNTKICLKQISLYFNFRIVVLVLRRVKKYNCKQTIFFILFSFCRYINNTYTHMNTYIQHSVYILFFVYLCFIFFHTILMFALVVFLFFYFFFHKLEQIKSHFVNKKITKLKKKRVCVKLKKKKQGGVIQ